MTHARPMFPPRADRKARSDREHVSLQKNSSMSAQFFEPKNCADREQFSGRSEATPPEALEAASQTVYVRTDIPPADLFKALGDARNEAAAAIERLIAILDLIDGNCDLEPAGDELDTDADDEPLLAAPEYTPDGDSWRRQPGLYRDRTGSQERWGTQGNLDDREGDAGHDDREGDELEHGGCGEGDDYELSGDEHEPSLGSFDRLTNQDHSYRQTASMRNWTSHRNEDFEKDAAQ